MTAQTPAAHVRKRPKKNKTHVKRKQAQKNRLRKQGQLILTMALVLPDGVSAIDPSLEATVNRFAGLVEFGFTKQQEQLDQQKVWLGWLFQKRESP